jgi:hypothetical protein
MTEDSGNWHLDKRVNVSIILTLVAQLVIFAFMYGKLESRVAGLEEKAEVIRLVPERMARLEAILERIERQLSGGR